MKIQVLVFMNEIKFDLTLKKKIKFSVSFMLLFAIIKLLPTLPLSSENLTFLFFAISHQFSLDQRILGLQYWVKTQLCTCT